MPTAGSPVPEAGSSPGGGGDAAPQSAGGPADRPVPPGKPAVKTETVPAASRPWPWLLVPTLLVIGGWAAAVAVALIGILAEPGHAPSIEAAWISLIGPFLASTTAALSAILSEKSSHSEHDPVRDLAATSCGLAWIEALIACLLLAPLEPQCADRWFGAATFAVALFGLVAVDLPGRRTGRGVAAGVTGLVCISLYLAVGPSSTGLLATEWTATGALLVCVLQLVVPTFAIRVVTSPQWEPGDSIPACLGVLGLAISWCFAWATPALGLSLDTMLMRIVEDASPAQKRTSPEQLEALRAAYPEAIGFRLMQASALLERGDPEGARREADRVRGAIEARSSSASGLVSSWNRTKLARLDEALGRSRPETR